MPLLEDMTLSEVIRSKYRALHPELADKISNFDPLIYFNSNPDVAEAAYSVEDLIRHFCEFGHRECRLYSPQSSYKALHTEAYPSLAAILESFNPEEYRQANQDVAAASKTERDLYQHYCHWGVHELRALGRGGGIIDRRKALALKSGTNASDDLCAYTHIYFPEIGPTLRPYLINLSALGSRICVSFSGVTFPPSEMKGFAEAIRCERSSNVNFLEAPKDGRDWGGFYALWQRFPPADESFVFFLHSKKSVHMAPIVGEMWRNELLAPLCGSYGAILNTVKKLRAGYSMVGSLLHKSHNVGPSRDLIEELLPLIGLDRSIAEGDFVAGAMFAIRGAVLNEFFQSLGGAIDFKRQAQGATDFDGSMAHACERLIGYLASTRGKGIAWVM